MAVCKPAEVLSTARLIVDRPYRSIGRGSDYRVYLDGEPLVPYMHDGTGTVEAELTPGAHEVGLSAGGGLLNVYLADVVAGEVVKLSPIPLNTSRRAYLFGLDPGWWTRGYAA